MPEIPVQEPPIQKHATVRAAELQSRATERLLNYYKYLPCEKDAKAAARWPEPIWPTHLNLGKTITGGFEQLLYHPTKEIVGQEYSSHVFHCIVPAVNKTYIVPANQDSPIVVLSSAKFLLLKSSYHAQTGRVTGCLPC